MSCLITAVAGMPYGYLKKRNHKTVPRKNILIYNTNRVLSSGTLQDIKEAVVKWIVKSCRPLTIAKDEGFVSMMKIATGCDKFVPPSYATVTETIHHMYSEEKTKLQTRLQAVPGVSMTADFWTSDANHSYLGVTVHFVEEWSLRSSILDVVEVPESHTAEVCGETLTRVMNEWHISDKVFTIVTDRGSNIVKGVREFTPSISTNCVAHIMQRGIALGMKAAEMESLLAKCRKIVGHFKHSALQSARLSQASQDLEIENLKLVQDVSTRWFSILAMAERLLSQRQAIAQVLDDTGACADSRITDVEFSRLEQMDNVLSKLKELSDWLGKYVTGSVVVHALRKLEKFLACCPDDPMYVASFKRAFSSYLDRNVQALPILKACAFLDPRFKTLKGIISFMFTRLHCTFVDMLLNLLLTVAKLVTLMTMR